MQDEHTNRDILTLVVIMVVFVSIIAALKVVDDKTGIIKDIGTRIVSRYI